ncbi:MAG: histidine phosphatase family protein [Daejeonella sp.]
MSEVNQGTNHLKSDDQIKKSIYIIRHGETDLNKKGIVQGRGINAELNDYGRSQGEAFHQAYKHIPFDKIYTSTLIRTHQTVEKFIESGIPWVQFEGLDELAWGVYEGMQTSSETKMAFRKMMGHWMSGNLDEKFDDGESPLEVKERQLTILENLIEHNDDKNILICMHGRAMRLFLCLLTDIPLSEMDRFPHTNTTLYKLTWNGSDFKIQDFNNTDHLRYLLS